MRRPSRHTARVAPTSLSSSPSTGSESTDAASRSGRVVASAGTSASNEQVVLAADRLLHPPHHERENRPGNADDEERGSPSEDRTHDAADTEADRLADRGRDALVCVRAPAQIRPVVVGDQRLRRRVVDGLADPERRAHDRELHEARDGRVERGDRAPRREHDRDDASAAVTVGQVPAGVRRQTPRARTRCRGNRPGSR